MIGRKILEVLEGLMVGFFWIFLSFFCLVFDPFFYLFLFCLSGVCFEYSLSFLFFVSIDLIGFFLHLDFLNEVFWSSKEILHFMDVREILDGLLIIFVFLGGLVCLFRRRLTVQVVRLSFKFVWGFCLVLVLVLLCFSWFWIEVFHRFVFSNDLWVLVPSDLSFYIFSHSFFILFIVCWILLLGCFYWIFKKNRFINK